MQTHKLVLAASQLPKPRPADATPSNAGLPRTDRQTPGAASSESPGGSVCLQDANARALSERHTEGCRCQFLSSRTGHLGQSWTGVVTERDSPRPPVEIGMDHWGAGLWVRCDVGAVTPS